MISASKSTLGQNNLKNLRPKVTKILPIRVRSFVNTHPELFYRDNNVSYIVTKTLEELISISRTKPNIC
jgi:hypothetical protein